VGNVAIDVGIHGSDMISGGNSIPLAQQHWSVTDLFSYGTGDHALVSSETVPGTANQGCADTSVAVRADHTSAATDSQIFWKLRIPDPQPTGSYSGSNTFTSVADFPGTQCASSLFMATTDFNGIWDLAYGVAVQSDGKIVLAGRADNPSGPYETFGLVRYDVSGVLDPSFGVGGKVSTEINAGYGSQANAVAIQPSDGKFVVVGRGLNAASASYFSLARYSADGSLDPLFGTGGIATTESAGIGNEAYAVAILGSGKIVVAGSDGAGGTTVAQFCPNGQLDDGTNCGGAGFGTGGIATVTGLEARSVAIQADGKIVVGGPDWLNGTFSVARLCTNGQLDDGINCGGAGFGTGGIVYASIGSQGEIKSVAIQPDGKIVALGISNGPIDGDFALVRYCDDGTLDDGVNCGIAGFGTGGIVISDLYDAGNNNSNNYARAMALQPDGKIVAVGHTGDYTNNDYTVVRYDTDGSLDTTFGSSTGYVFTDFAGFNESARAVAIQSDGKIVAAGNSESATDNDFALVRYTATGAVDER